MNFNDALLTIDLTLESGAVPLIIGESGIGKTSLVKQLGNDNGYYVVNIDANLLKEGEIGGLPTVDEHEVNINGKVSKKKKTVYAVHTKLLEIEKVLEEDSTKKILLFIDEINRCEHTVQQELMNIILNREINGYVLPENVYVIAAMNPSNKYKNIEYSNYQVVEMDPAQEDRFVWIELECNVKSWMQWGFSKEANIHKEILQFISTFPDYLHTPYSEEAIKATPRSWERVSKAYDIYINKKSKYPSSIFYNIVKGNVGGSIAQDFINFIEENKDPFIKPEDIFKDNDLSDDVINRLKEESHSRLYLEAKNALLYLQNKNNRKKEIELFSQFIQLYPEDLRLGIMKELKFHYDKDLYEDFLKNETFIESFFLMFEQMEE